MKSQYIGIITKPIGKAGLVPLLNMMNIIHAIDPGSYVITGGEARSIIKEDNKNSLILPYKYQRNICLRAFSHFLMQVRISLKILRLKNTVGIWIFMLDSHALSLPVITAKLLRKKIIFALAASIEKSDQAHNEAMNKLIIYSEKFNNMLADRLVLYSPNLIDDWSLGKFRKKIFIANHHILDFAHFKPNTSFDTRKKLIGYIGRFSEEKGIQSFIKCIPEVVKFNNDVNFLIGGDGPLRDIIEKYLKTSNINDKAIVTGWISYYDLPKYLNDLKLIVLPSFTEGLPNIMLEAMACGTPVLATPVGAIPDYIKDGNTGFLMENNSPECIAKNILRVLSHPDLKQIAKTGRDLVEIEFTINKAVERYKNLILSFK
jgi:glycosyltransferase involved in cell wall biosynthesis